MGGQIVKFLRAFAELQKDTLNFVMGVFLSVRLEQLVSPWTDFHKILHISIFRKSAEETRVSLYSDKNNSYFTRRPTYIYDKYLTPFFL
jgi:hypothetical protein